MDFKKVSVLLPPLDFDRLEAYCAETGHKKSPLIARLLRDHLNAEGFELQSDAPSERSPAKRDGGDRRAKGRATKTN
jgi:hypothetical protein